MLITAKFDGKCAACGQPTLRGSEIEYVNKKAFHPNCIEAFQAAQKPDADQFALASRLGFVALGDPLPFAEWRTWKADEERPRQRGLAL